MAFTSFIVHIKHGKEDAMDVNILLGKLLEAVQDMLDYITKHSNGDGVKQALQNLSHADLNQNGKLHLQR